MSQFKVDTIKRGPEAIFEMLVEDHQIKPTWIAGYKELAMPVLQEVYRYAYFFYASVFFPQDRKTNLWNMIQSGTPMEAVKDYAEQFLSSDEANKTSLMALAATKRAGDLATNGFWAFLRNIPEN